MQGNEQVIAELNQGIQAELTMILQYIVHAEMCNNWGYTAYGALLTKQAMDEMRHLDSFIERVLYFDGEPNVNVTPTPKVGKTFKFQVENDLEAEREAVRMYNASVRVCVEAGDNGTRELFESILKQEEDHVDFLEAQIHMINEIGVDNYLSRQMKNPGEGA